MVFENAHTHPNAISHCRCPKRTLRQSSQVSQPSLSMQIQKAEDELGVTIFDRTKKPVIATDQGLRILEQVRVILREYAKLIDISQYSADHLTGTLHVAVIPTLAPYIIPIFANPFMHSYPDVSLHIDEMKTEDLIVALREDRLDVGILATPLEEPGIIEKPLFYEPFYFYAQANDELLHQDTVNQVDLSTKDLWLLKDGHCFRNQVTNFCARPTEVSQGTSQVSFEGSNFETLRNLILQGGGATLVPHLFVSGLSPAEKRSNTRPFHPIVPTREVSLVYHRSQWKRRLLDALWQTLIDHLPSDLPREPLPGMKVLEF